MSTLDLLSLKGQKVEHFEVGDYIGLGRSGVVFRAVDTDDGKPVALKIFKPEVVHGEEIIQRFIRAMTTMLPLTHPNLVRLYGAGKSGPLCWMSMEFVEGEDMTQVIDKIGRDGMLGWQYALRVAVHIGRALEYAQTHQVIHRNISPTNIILRSQDNTLKLGDMMLAKALENSEEQITAIGQVVGDPRYMAPERTYENVPIDGRADIYGLGATVYALLTGKPPFEGESVSATIKMLRNNQPLPPGEYPQSIQKALESIVLRMLAKKPEHRFQTPTEMLQALTNMAAQHDMRV